MTDLVKYDRGEVVRAKDFDDAELDTFLELPEPAPTYRTELGDVYREPPTTQGIDLRGSTGCSVVIVHDQSYSVRDGNDTDGHGGSFKLWVAIVGSCMFCMVALVSYAVVGSILDRDNPQVHVYPQAVR